jgi:plastocyanin
MRRASLIVLLLAASCGKAKESAVHQVAIRGMQFEPATLVVSVGDTVVWTNEDIVPHTATAPGLFDSGSLASHQQWRYRVTKAGDVAYMCSFHPTMKGTLSAR